MVTFGPVSNRLSIAVYPKFCGALEASLSGVRKGPPNNFRGIWKARTRESLFLHHQNQAAIFRSSSFPIVLSQGARARPLVRYAVPDPVSGKPTSDPVAHSR